jgi:hypothetical protein
MILSPELLECQDFLMVARVYGSYGSYGLCVYGSYGSYGSYRPPWYGSQGLPPNLRGQRATFVTSVHAVEQLEVPLENLRAMPLGQQDLQCVLEGGTPLIVALS